MVRMPVYPAACMAVCVGLVTLIPEMAPPAHAQSPDPVRANMPMDQLKSTYLDCERAAMAGDLNAGAIGHCSIVYEELKRRAFGGNFQRLKVWSDAQARLHDVSG
jgi:hypothetical protein